MKFKIVLINFPFDDLSKTKLRPAICLTDLLTERFHVILAFISSQIQNKAEPTDFFLNVSVKDFNQTGLRQPSVIRLHRLISVADSLIVKVIGELPEHYHNEIYSRLNRLFSK